MEKIKKMMFINEEMDNELKKRIDQLARIYFVKHRKKFIADYIDANFQKLMNEDRALTSREAMDMLQISRSTLNRRITLNKLRPINPEERVHRFLRNEIIEHLNSRKGGRYDR